MVDVKGAGVFFGDPKEGVIRSDLVNGDGFSEEGTLQLP